MHIEECRWKVKEPSMTINLLKRTLGHGKAFIVENGVPDENEGWFQIKRDEIQHYGQLNHDIYYGVARGNPALIYARSVTNIEKSVTRGIGKISTENNHKDTGNTTKHQQVVKLTEAPNVAELIAKVRSKGNLKEAILQHKIDGLVLDYLSELEG